MNPISGFLAKAQLTEVPTQPSELVWEIPTIINLRGTFYPSSVYESAKKAWEVVVKVLTRRRGNALTIMESSSNVQILQWATKELLVAEAGLRLCPQFNC